MSWWYFTQPSTENRLASAAGQVTLATGLSGLVLSVLWGGALLGQLGLVAMLGASATAVLGLVAAVTGWGERTEQSLQIAVSGDEAVTTLRLTGDLNHATRHVFCERVKALIGDGNRQFVVDMDGIEDFDSTGLGSLVSALKRAREGGGDLKVRCKPGPVRHLFEITNLTREFGIADHRAGLRTAPEET